MAAFTSKVIYVTRAIERGISPSRKVAAKVIFIAVLQLIRGGGWWRMTASDGGEGMQI
jgi:hypothetical protein